MTTTQILAEDDPIHAVVCKAANEMLEPFGQFVCEVRSGQAFSGEDALFVEICYYSDAVPVPALDTLKLRSRLRSALLDMNEARFPYLAYRLERPAAA